MIGLMLEIMLYAGRLPLLPPAGPVPGREPLPARVPHAARVTQADRAAAGGAAGVRAVRRRREPAPRTAGR